jgi:pimeloyl-ACP methyl ester carboxylesterase
VAEDVLARAATGVRLGEERPRGCGAGVAVYRRKSGAGRGGVVLTALAPDRFEVVTGAADQGAGTVTMIARVTANALGVDESCVEVVQRSTAEAIPDQGAGASRVTRVLGMAARVAGEAMRARLAEEPGARGATVAVLSNSEGRLAELLEETVREWPVPVDEIVLVGHSMGGLVARSACHHGGDWSRAVRHVFCLGSPHLGAPLEKGAHAVGYALNRLPETRALATLVNGRSVGIKDLRFGSCAEDELDEVPFLDCATYYFVGATLTRRKESLVGDLLVQFPSASGNGKRRRIPFEVDHGMHLPRANHFQLLNHPAVYEQLASWLRAAGGAAVPDSRRLPPPRPPDGRDDPCQGSSPAAGAAVPPG